VKALLLLCTVLFSFAANAQTATIGEVLGSTDDDGFDALRLRAGGLWRFASPYDYTGAVAQTSRYAYQEWREDAPAVLFVWRDQRRDTLAGTMGEAGLVRIGGRTRVIGDAVWSLRPEPRTGFELILAGDLIETQRALERGTAYTFAAISGERQFGERFTAIGLAGYQRFTDGNARPHARGRLIYLLHPDHGITAQLRWRQFGSEELDDPGYFNPDRYREWQVALAMRKRYAGWQLYGSVGAGRETISSDITNPTLLVDVRAEGTVFRDVRVMARASYNRSAGFGLSEDYWYRVASVSVIVPIVF
jgi:hypothetical protein